MSHITRVEKLFKKAHDLSVRMLIEEQIEAKEAFERYLEGTRFQGRKYNNLAFLEAHPALSALIGAGLGFIPMNENAKQALMGVAPKLLEGGFSASTRFYHNQINTFEKTVLKRKELLHSQAHERSQQAQKFIDHLSQIFSNVLHTAAGK
jgi:hypothetical protein